MRDTNNTLWVKKGSSVLHLKLPEELGKLFKANKYTFG
jgi:hypothetical protein